MEKEGARPIARPRGFAAMDAERQRAIARKGGESVPKEKRSFARNPALAVEAGRKGGQSVAPEQRSFSKNPSLAAEAGRKGGEVTQKAARKRHATSTHDADQNTRSKN
jgi:general stress protein YciG